MFGHPVKRRVKKQQEEQVWIEEEGNRKVVKVANSLALPLKEEVCNSFVAIRWMPLKILLRIGYVLLRE